jgi:hypothetical protein
MKDDGFKNMVNMGDYDYHLSHQKEERLSSFIL